MKECVTLERDPPSDGAFQGIPGVDVRVDVDRVPRSLAVVPDRVSANRPA